MAAAAARKAERKRGVQKKREKKRGKATRKYRDGDGLKKYVSFLVRLLILLH